MDYQQRINARSQARRTAAALGWFSIGLGLAELLFARRLARRIGMPGREGLLCLYGVREIATGVGILAARDRAPWIWARVAGDALDMATLAAHAPRQGATAGMATAIGAVAGAAVLDVATARALEKAQARLQAPARDYSDRSGFPMGVEAVRGIARRDFVPPADMRPPEPPRPTVH